MIFSKCKSFLYIITKGGAELILYKGESAIWLNDGRNGTFAHLAIFSPLNPLSARRSLKGALVG